MRATNAYKYVIVVFLLVALGFFALFLNYFRTPDTPQVPVYETRVAREVPVGWHEYKNEQYLFSVLYQDGMTVTEESKDDAMTITFQNAEAGTGFQLFIIPYSAPTISQKRFLADIPLGVREGEEKVFVDGVEAVQFWSKDVALGDTREIWFIKKPYLYEVTTLAPLATWLQEILKTWQFL
jgi:hypothetical protein